MSTDLGLRYVSPRRWCWKASDGSWLKSSKYDAKCYLQARRGLSERKPRNSLCSPIDAAIEETIQYFHVDLAGHYDFDEEIHTAVHQFIADLPIDSQGHLPAGEYRLPDGRLMLLMNDIQLCLKSE
jgi:hypothetical protein